MESFTTDAILDCEQQRAVHLDLLEKTRDALKAAFENKAWSLMSRLSEKMVEMEKKKITKTEI